MWRPYGEQYSNRASCRVILAGRKNREHQGDPIKAPGSPHMKRQKKTENTTVKGEMLSAVPENSGSRWSPITNCMTVRANRMISGMREGPNRRRQAHGSRDIQWCVKIHLKIAGRDPIQPLRTQCFAETNGAATVGERFFDAAQAAKAKPR